MNDSVKRVGKKRRATLPPLDPPAALAGDEVLPTAEDYRRVGTGELVSVVRSASAYFRNTMKPGIAARYTNSAEYGPLFDKLNEAAKQLRHEVSNVFHHYQRIFSTKELALLLESWERVELTFRALTDDYFLTNFNRVQDHRIRAAIVAHLRFGNQDAYIDELAAAMTNRELGLPGSDSKVSQHERNKVFDAKIEEVKRMLAHNYVPNRPLLALAAFPTIRKRLIREGVLTEANKYPTIFLRNHEFGPFIILTFDAFCDLFIIGQRPHRELPPVMPLQTDAVAALIGLNGAPPAPIERIRAQDVDQAEAWLRASVEHGLATWDDMLSVYYYFVRPKWLWQQPLKAQSKKEPRPLRFGANFFKVFYENHRVCLYSYQKGVPASDAYLSMLSQNDMKALTIRIHEYYQHQIQLVRQFEAMTLQQRSLGPAYGHGTGYYNGVYYGPDHGGLGAAGTFAYPGYDAAYYGGDYDAHADQQDAYYAREFAPSAAHAQHPPSHVPAGASPVPWHYANE
ncbi:hypothetical protein H9P43_002129 [Blastocladiella emersonii ATCC 22665]|nr:hypothetical protein H9P43_002129 [Blastocladiella emersonii ATCC 22665]